MDTSWFLKYVDSYDANVDEILGDLIDDIEMLNLPDIVVRPRHLKRLRVSVPTDPTFSAEWLSDIATKVYPNLPIGCQNGSQKCRLDYLKQIDFEAFVNTPYPRPKPPQVDV